MPTLRLIQGSDKKIELFVIKDGLAVDIQTAISVKANLVVNGKTQKIYSNLPSGDEGVLTIPLLHVNKINLFVERGDSILFDVGIGYIDILIAFENLEFPDSNFVETITISRVQIIKGTSLNIDIP